MAAARKDLLTRLADAGEDAISRLGDARGMDRMVGFANTTRDRIGSTRSDRRRECRR